MSISHYSESKIYRRTKYYVFSLFVLLAALLLTAIIHFSVYYILVPRVIFPLIPSAAQPTFSGVWNTIVNAPIWVDFIVNTILFLFLFVIIRGAFLGGWIGRLFVAWQNLRDSGRYGSGGNARFAGMFEEYLSTKKDKTSLYVGRSLFSSLWEIEIRDDRHMLTIAGSRSGKGASCIIPNLLRWNGSVLCIDPKGTNANVTAKKRRRKGNVVHIIDPFNVIPNEEPAYFNPLDTIEPSSLTVVEEIRLISEALIPAEADDKNQHFTESARAFIDGYITHVITSDDYKNPSLIDVFNIVNMSAEEAIDTHANMMANEACGGLAQQTARRILDTMGTNEFNSVVATMRTNLKWIASKAMTETLSKSSFSFQDMKNEKTSVFLVIPPNLLSTHKIFLRLFVNAATGQYTKGGKAKVPALFIIDECPALGYMEEIAKAYGEVASYNLIFWTFFQDKGQLNLLYGSRAQTFIGSSRAVQVFSVRDEDAEWAAKMIGTKGTASTAAPTSTTTITSHRDAASVEREIGRDSGKQYIFKAGKTPMILSLRPYHQSLIMAPDAARDPDHPWPPKAYTRGRMMIRSIGYVIMAFGGIMFVFPAGMFSLLTYGISYGISSLILPSSIAQFIGYLIGGAVFAIAYFYIFFKQGVPTIWQDMIAPYADD